MQIIYYFLWVFSTTQIFTCELLVSSSNRTGSSFVGFVCLIKWSIKIPFRSSGGISSFNAIWRSTTNKHFRIFELGKTNIGGIKLPAALEAQVSVTRVPLSADVIAPISFGYEQLLFSSVFEPLLPLFHQYSIFEKCKTDIFGEFVDIF